MKSTALLVGLWIAQTIFSTGACTAYFDGKYPDLGSHLPECTAIGIIPGSPIVSIFMSHFLGYGWHL